MDCERTQERLHEYLCDLLGDLVRSDIRAHLETCADCRMALDAASRELALLDRWTVDPPRVGLSVKNIVGPKPDKPED